MQPSREQRRALMRENAKLPLTLQEVPPEQWPARVADPRRLKVFRSRHFLVQVFKEDNPDVHVRLSINRTQHNGDRWEDGITWDDLQRLKREAGYGDHDAVEIHPCDRDVVNVANMRHLWVLCGRLPYAWDGDGRART